MGTMWHSCTVQESSEAQRETVVSVCVCWLSWRTMFCRHTEAVNLEYQQKYKRKKKKRKSESDVLALS